jgi:transcriptional regulator with XRE-family HTH domain
MLASLLQRATTGYMGTSPPARPLWDRLESIRISNGWTRQQLADRAGVARTTIDRWKTQQRSPLPPLIKDVAKRLGIDYDEALELAGVTGSRSEETRRRPGTAASPESPSWLADAEVAESELDEANRALDERLRRAREIARGDESRRDRLERFLDLWETEKPS